MSKFVKVILKDNIPHVGKKNDLKSVRFGFAKNWLIPRKLAMLASPGLRNQLAQIKIAQEKKGKQEAGLYEELSQKLEGFALTMRPKKTKKGTLYAAIDASVLAKKLQEKKFEIDEKYIVLDKPIKKVGEYEVPIIFSDNYKTKIKVIVQ